MKLNGNKLTAGPVRRPEAVLRHLLSKSEGVSNESLGRESKSSDDTRKQESNMWIHKIQILPAPRFTAEERRSAVSLAGL
jgi:hypothetical protein